MESLYEIDDVTGMTSGRGFSSPELLNLLMNTWRGSSVKIDIPIDGLYLGRSLRETCGDPGASVRALEAFDRLF